MNPINSYKSPLQRTVLSLAIVVLGITGPSFSALAMQPVELIPTWIGATSNDWLDMNNWIDDVPTVGLNSVIDSINNPPEINSAGALSNSLNIGVTATGFLTISSGGTLTTIGQDNIAQGAGSTGAVTVTGSASSWTNASIINIGAGGNGTLSILEGGTVSAAGVTIAQNTGSTGMLIIGTTSGSTATAAGMLSTSTVAFGAGTGSILFNHTATDYNFTPTITGGGTIAALSGVTTLSGNLSGFTGSTIVSDSARLFLTGNHGGDMDVQDGGTASLDSAIGGNLTLSGTSTAALSGSGTISGDVAVGAGSTFANNGSVSGDVVVSSGGTLKGSGTIGGNANINSGATVAPGNSIGTLTVLGGCELCIGNNL